MECLLVFIVIVLAVESDSGTDVDLCMDEPPVEEKPIIPSTSFLSSGFSTTSSISSTTGFSTTTITSTTSSGTKKTTSSTSLPSISSVSSTESDPSLKFSEDSGKVNSNCGTASDRRSSPQIDLVDDAISETGKRIVHEFCFKHC
ncbi:unnamed protein product [Rodentolepis nana]|uniref:Uncharacterized protein n=1 Tax=Rodentolepis nana TaxID=102285 RepID=A0A0R3TQP6_RODNA|nr:unnamed protein product [Rodentolepis nana]